MKKITALILVAIMFCTFLVSCGDPVYDDLENFVNVELKEINKNAEKIKEETATWAELDDLDAMLSSLTEVLIPLVDDSVKKIEKITTETEEVTALKDKYLEAMKAYQEGFAVILEGIQEIDQDKMITGRDKINEGMSLFEEYNSDLKALAKEVGADVKY